MRRLIYALLFFPLCIFIQYAKGQDIHFSQYNAAPLQLNPALTGVNGQDYRVGASYKSQWGNVGKYNTVAASYDMAVLRRSAKSNYGGIGVSLFSDRAGDLSFSTNQVNISLSYTVILNKNASQLITAGLVGGFGQRSIDYSKVTTDNQFGESGYDPNLSTGENFGNSRKLYADVGAGLLWSYSKDKNTNFYAGAAVTHLNQPNLSLLNNREEKLFVKITMHGGAHFKLANQLYLLPSFMILNQGPHWEYNIGTLLKFKKSNLPTDRTAFYIGAAYRVKDAVIFMGRVDIVGINIGISYDMNLSKLTPATKLNGGPEISLVYTGAFKNRKNTHNYCPML